MGGKLSNIRNVSRLEKPALFKLWSGSTIDNQQTNKIINNKSTKFVKNQRLDLVKPTGMNAQNITWKRGNKTDAELMLLFKEYTHEIRREYHRGNYQLLRDLFDALDEVDNKQYIKSSFDEFAAFLPEKPKKEMIDDIVAYKRQEDKDYNISIDENNDCYVRTLYHLYFNSFWKCEELKYCILECGLTFESFALELYTIDNPIQNGMDLQKELLFHLIDAASIKLFLCNIKDKNLNNIYEYLDYRCETKKYRIINLKKKLI